MNYAMTDSIGMSILGRIADNVEVPLQKNKDPNDVRGGSTIGPPIAAKTGVKTVDLGIGIHSMHSSREMAGTLDLLYLKNLCVAFWQNYGKVNHDLLSS